MTYRAYGSFAPLYTDAIEQLYQKLYPDRARQAENVLRRIAEHASPVGTCWPGIRRLMHTCRYGEGTIKRSLVYLTDHFDFVRFHVEHSRARRRADITWQINPRVIWIVSDYIIEAETLWNEALKGSNVILKEQPDSESRIRTSASNQNQNQTQNHHHHQNSETGSGGKPAANTDGQRAAPTSARRGRKTAAAVQQPGEQVAYGDESETVTEGDKTHQRAAPESDPNPPSPPSPPPLGECAAPLEDVAAEDLAQTLYGRGYTRITQARQLILQFSSEEVQDALLWLQTEEQGGRSIERPFGLMKWWLMSKAITGAPPDESAKYTTGKYSEFIKR